MTDEFTGPAVRLTDADLAEAADTLGVELAAVQAVAEVEAAGDGFLPDKRPKILFESYQFHKRTGGIFDATHPRISKDKWTRDYLGGAREYERLKEAIALNRPAALKSASWGRFQIMGFNHKGAGFDDVEAFVTAHVESEVNHLKAFMALIRSHGLLEFLRTLNWPALAKGWNGPGYAKNQYDLRLAEAYLRHARK